MGSILSPLVARLGRRKALDVPAGMLQRVVSGAFSAAGARGRKVQNVLNGVWLGHPLHPVLTDLPIGFWTSASVFDALDMLGGEEWRPAADLTLAAGVACAVPTAMSGLADWQFTMDEPRRVGYAHAALNSGALALCVWSLLLRRRGKRTAGRTAALAGFTIATASAYLGGDLISKFRVGVDHSRGDALPTDFVAVANDAEIVEGKPSRVQANGQDVVLVRQNGQLYALANTCAHLGGPLAEGQLRDDGIICPWHGSCFALDDGRVLDGPSTFPQPTLETRVRDGKIEVRRSSAATSG